jgi:hypothetical protein
VTLLPELRCHWSETVDGVHVLCPLEATFAKEESWPTDDGWKTGRVPLCLQHALQRSAEERGQ